MKSYGMKLQVKNYLGANSVGFIMHSKGNRAMSKSMLLLEHTLLYLALILKFQFHHILK